MLKKMKKIMAGLIKQSIKTTIITHQYFEKLSIVNR